MIAKLKNSDNMIVRMMMIVVNLALVMGIVGIMTVNSFGNEDDTMNEFSFIRFHQRQHHIMMMHIMVSLIISRYGGGQRPRFFCSKR